MGKLHLSAKDIYNIYWEKIDTGHTLAQIGQKYGVGTGTICFVNKNIKKYWDGTKHASKAYKVAVKLIKDEENRRVTVSENAKTVKSDIETDQVIQEVVDRSSQANPRFKINLSSSPIVEKPEHVRKLEYAYELFQKALIDYTEAEFNIKNKEFLKEYHELKDLMEQAKGESLITGLQKRFNLTVSP